MSTQRQRELLQLLEKHQQAATTRDACTCGDEGHGGLMGSGEATVNHWRHLVSLIAPAKPQGGVIAPVGKPNMIMRSIRVPEALWVAAKERAEERNENISDVIRDALTTYTQEEA